jgi:RNA polymerase sigma-70 factor (ECF subfamily)
MHDSSDADLARQARQGDVDAYGELVRRYQTSVFNVCYRLLADRGEAEDMTQEAFLRAQARLDRFDLERPFGPWMRRVAANLCLNRLQRRAPAQVALEEEGDLPAADRSDGPEQIHEARERNDALRAAILALPPHYRSVIELRHFHDLSYDEIAAALKMTVSDVRSHLYRARRQLARRLTPDGTLTPRSS